MKLAAFTTRNKIVNLQRTFPKAIFYDTSTNAPTARDYSFVTDFREFSPFVPYGNIPVPRSSYTSDSVEGVWQGLKVIKGRTDKSYFRGKGRQRPGVPKGHQYGKQIIGYEEARKKIFVPTYRWMVQNRCDLNTLEEVYARAMEDMPQFFFDVDTNGNIGVQSSALAHSSVLVEIINAELQRRVREEPLREESPRAYLLPGRE